MAAPFGSPLPQQYQFSSQPGMFPGYGGQQAQPDQYNSWDRSPGFGAIDDEPPILEELDIDVGAIVAKSVSILTARVGSDSLRDVDMGGPVLIAASLATIHLLSGKLHFGVIFGWSIMAFTLFWFTVHQLAGNYGQADKEVIDLYNCSACLGYCLLPMVVANVLAVFLPAGSPVMVGLLAIASCYCAFLSGKLVTKRALFLQDQLWTIVYPAFLYYSVMALLSLY